MNKRGIILIVSFVLVTIIAVVSLCTIFFNPSLEQSMYVRGYEISIPNGWFDDSKGNIYNKAGELVGNFSVFDEASPFDIKENGTPFSDNIVKYEDFFAGSEPAVLYLASSLPNPEPYAAGLVLYDEYVSDALADKIAKSFKIPKLGKNPPQKNIKSPNEESSVVKTKFKDESIFVKNASLFIEAEEKLLSKESFGINIVYYEEKEEKQISSWKYLECDDGVFYLYTYYDKGDGIYTYNNNPLIFNKMERVICDDEESTKYYLKYEDKEPALLIEFPLNRYRDNAKELLALKTNNAKSADIQRILEKILSKQELKNVSFEYKNGILSIFFKDGVVADKAKSYSHSAVIFGLVGNIETINISYQDSENFTFTKTEIDKKTEEKIDDVAKSEKTFVEYTEKLQEENKNDGEIVYSATVVISYNTKVPHPETGKKVEAGPYAKKMGYEKYLGVPINCVIKRSGSGYIATAYHNGLSIAVYNLENKERLNWAISMIKAYS